MSSNVRYFLLVSMLCGAGLAEAAMQQQRVDDARPGHLYVQFTAVETSPAAGKSGIAAFDRRAAVLGVTSIEKAFPSLETIAEHRTLSPELEALRSVYVVRYTGPHHPRAAARSLDGIDGVGYAEPIYMRRFVGGSDDILNSQLDSPNDPKYGDQTYLERMRLPEAWDEVKGEDGTVVIAIVDAGTAWKHEDLKANVWTNPNEIADNGLDDDGNGFVDDLHGWNFEDNMPDPTGRPNSPNGDHGSAVAGAAAAHTDNDVGIAGTSWNATYMAVNISCPGVFYPCFELEGYLYAALNGADVITSSFGAHSAMITERLTIRAALAEGALIVTASGNDDFNVDLKPFYPAAYNETLSVGGIKKESDQNVYNFGRTVNVFAPAVGIEVTDATGYTIAEGTSLAVPLVVGMSALVKTANPSWGPERIREQIRLTAVNIDAANPGIAPGNLGRGKVDAYAAITEDPLPALRVVEYSYVNQDSEAAVRLGDRVTATITFKNFHGDGEGIRVKLMEDDGYVVWGEQEVELGTVPHGATVSAEFTFTKNGRQPPKDLIRLSPEITAGTLVDRPDIIRLAIVEHGIATHETGALKVSITDEGNIGYETDGFSFDPVGEGFQVRQPEGQFEHYLSEGGLLIATSADKVSDCLRGTNSDGGGQQDDFVLAQGSKVVVTTPGTRNTQKGRVILTDAAAVNPIGVEVLQESFTRNDAANEDVFILRYEVTNTNSDPISDVHVGLFMDWDLAATRKDETAFDQARGVGYFINKTERSPRFAGTVLLSDTPTLHYRAIDNDAVTIRLPPDGGFTSQEKWESMTGGVQEDGVVATVTNVSQLTAAGPFALESGESVVVAFALVSGTSESDFLTNVDQAKALWSAIETDVHTTPVPEDKWMVHAPFPNPATFPVTIRYETGAPGTVEIAIYDALGRRVRRLTHGTRTQGGHTVTWNGQNEQGARVPSGLYLVRMLGESGSQPILRSKPILVVR